MESKEAKKDKSIMKGYAMQKKGRSMQEPFCATRYQAPNRTSPFHWELGSGILSRFFTGRPFHGVE
jgi:hypothetical protein